MIISFSFLLVVQQYAFRIYDNQIYDKSSQVLNLSSASIENELKKFETLSFNMIADKQIQEQLLGLKSDMAGYNKQQARKQLEDAMLDYSGYAKHIYSIQFIDNNLDEYVAGNPFLTPSGKKQTIVRKAEQAAGQIAWIYPDDQDPALIAIREVRAFTNSEFSLEHLGTLIIRVKLDDIISEFTKGADHQTGNLIIAADNKVVFPRDPGFTEEQLLHVLNNPDKYSIEHIGIESFFTTRVRSDYTGWTYLNKLPYNSIFEKITLLKTIVGGVFLFILVLVILLGMNLARSITRPIEYLITTMKRIEKSDWGQMDGGIVEPVDIPMDEVGQLHRTFRMMIQRIHELIKENYLKQLMLRDTEFRALQAQINPHFLYNTLESINWMAKVNKQTHIITVAEELDIMRSYVTIQKFRFEERLDLRLEVEDEALDYCIPKLTLQPLLENAIQYALEPMIEPCTITVRIRTASSYLLLEVEDQGPGMDAEFLHKLRSGEVTTKGKGIGLANMEERIRLTFGEAYGIQIDSSPGIGTRVGVKLPLEKGVNRV
jgi:two-component system sensor histidine kinase YesM